MHHFNLSSVNNWNHLLVSFWAKTATWGLRCDRGDKLQAPKSQPVNATQQRSPSFFTFADSHVPPSYHESVWFEQQVVITRVRRGSCLCSSCDRPLCGGCGLTHDSCSPPFCVGPGSFPGFVPDLWLGLPRYCGALVGNWKRGMEVSQQKHWWSHQVSLLPGLSLRRERR